MRSIEYPSSFVYFCFLTSAIICTGCGLSTFNKDDDDDDDDDDDVCLLSNTFNRLFSVVDVLYHISETLTLYRHIKTAEEQPTDHSLYGIRLLVHWP